MKKSYFYIAALVLVACAIVAVISFSCRGTEENTAAPEAQLAADAMAFPERTVVTVEREGPATVEKTISVATLQDGLKEMGILITEEYYFTEVVSYSSVKEFLGMKIDATETTYLVGYDGVVTAGVDFTAITVEADEENRVITVHIPAATVQNTVVDTGSFTLYSEKQGWWNPASAADYNASLKELETNARGKALEKGLLTRADENAQKLICNFIRSFAEAADYTVVIAGK